MIGSTPVALASSWNSKVVLLITYLISSFKSLLGILKVKCPQDYNGPLLTYALAHTVTSLLLSLDTILSPLAIICYLPLMTHLLLRHT